MNIYETCLNWIMFRESIDVQETLSNQLHGFSQNFKKKEIQEMYHQHKKQNFISSFRVCTLFQIIMNIYLSMNSHFSFGETKTSISRLVFAIWLICSLVLFQQLRYLNWINKINFLLVFNSFIHVAIHANFQLSLTSHFDYCSSIQLADGLIQTSFALSYLIICPSWQCKILILLGYFIPLMVISKDYVNFGQFYEYMLVTFVCFLIRMVDKQTKLMWLQVDLQKQNNMACKRIFDECVPSSIIIVKTSNSNQNFTSPRVSNQNEQLINESQAIQNQCQLLYANKFAQQYLDCCVGYDCVQQIEAISVIQENDELLNLIDVLKSSSWADIIQNEADYVQYALGQDQRVLNCSRLNIDQTQNSQTKQYCDITLRSCIWEGERSIIIVLNDTTDRATSIEYFKDLNTYKDQLLATVSHDLKTPLNAIQLLLFTIKELCENNITLDATQIKSILQYVNDINQSNSMLITMINDLLDYSQMRNGKLRLNADLFSLDECLQTVFTIFNGQTKSKKLNLIFERINFSDSLNIKTDQNRLKQILINLLSNSLKFTFEGHIKLIINNQEPFIDFIVEDTGIGMPQYVVEKLFKSYATFNLGNQNKQGVGLGLVISSKLVGLLGPTETIAVESKEGNGTRFMFRIYKRLIQRHGSLLFDLKSKSDTEIAQHPKPTHYKLKFINSPSRVTRSHYQVMIVDDTIFNITAFKIILQKVMNCHVTDAYNGLDAVKSVQQGQKYDLIFMDISMPVMDGYQATELIRKYEVEQENKPSIIIMASAYTLEQEYQRIQQYGADGLIEKPIDTKILAEILKKYNFID